jgi:predicted DNA-binding transcriptional regulator AlpA
MLAMLDAATSVQATADKPCPASLGLIEYGSLTDLLNITRPTLDKKAKDPKENFPKRVMLGKRYYIRLCDLKRWLDEKYRG